MTPRDICVVIPVLNERLGIAAAIASVREAGQIIVVDGGSSDGTIEIAKSVAEVTFISSKPGRGSQLAIGATHCRCAVLLFLHGDCYLSPESLLLVAQAITNGDQWGAMRQSIAAAGLQYRLLESGNSTRVRVRGLPFGDQAMFMLTELYWQVGGIEDIPLMEDLRLSKRLRKKSWPALINATVIVNPRRWQKRGVVRQTLRNWLIQLLHLVGMSPQQLSRLYSR